MKNKIIQVILKLLAKRSNDPNYKLGSFTTRGWRITSIGTNTIHSDGSCTHAEVSALQSIQPDKRPLTTLYCSWSPCKDCEAYIRQHGIKIMYYSWKYKGNDVPEFCKQLK